MNSCPSSLLDLFSVDLNLPPPLLRRAPAGAGGGAGTALSYCVSVELRDGHVVVVVVITDCKNVHVVAATENGPSAIDLKPQQSGRLADRGAPPGSERPSPAEATARSDL